VPQVVGNEAIVPEVADVHRRSSQYFCGSVDNVLKDLGIAALDSTLTTTVIVGSRDVLRSIGEPMLRTPIMTGQEPRARPGAALGLVVEAPEFLEPLAGQDHSERRIIDVPVRPQGAVEGTCAGYDISVGLDADDARASAGEVANLRGIPKQHTKNIIECFDFNSFGAGIEPGFEELDHEIREGLGVDRTVRETTLAEAGMCIERSDPEAEEVFEELLGHSTVMFADDADDAETHSPVAEQPDGPDDALVASAPDGINPVTIV